MPAFTVEDVVRGTRGALIGGDLAVPVTGVSIDSRTLAIGEVFFVSLDWLQQPIDGG